MKIFIIIPAFNESNKIGQVLKGIKKFKLPIIVINDGSTDSTEDVVKKYKITYIKHDVNLGKGAAIKTGCMAAWELGADAVIMMDGDGQHYFGDIPKFKKALVKDKFEVVFGSRTKGKGTPFVRLFGNRLASFVISILFGIYVSDLICGFRALTKEAFKRLNLQSSGYSIETEMVVKTGLKKLASCEIPVKNIYYDKYKGVTMFDAIMILFEVISWRLR